MHVDDLGEYEVSLVDKGANLVGTVSPLHRRSEERCSFRGTVGNGARLTSQQWFMESPRYVTDGWAGGRDMPAIYISKFINSTFWTLAQSKVTRRTTQGFAEHLVQVHQARRVLARCFDRTWRMIGRGPWPIPVIVKFCSEQTSAVARAPLCDAGLQAPFDDGVAASDASESGADAVRSVCRCPVRLQTTASLEREGIALGSEHRGLFSLFDGKDRVRRTVAFSGGAPKDPCCFAIDPACVRVVDPAWPGIRHTGDERKVSSRTWRKSMQVNQCVRLWILSRGFPRPDLSQQDALGESLDGARPESSRGDASFLGRGQGGALDLPRTGVPRRGGCQHSRRSGRPH